MRFYSSVTGKLKATPKDAKEQSSQSIQQWFRVRYVSFFAISLIVLCVKQAQVQIFSNTVKFHLL